MAHDFLGSFTIEIPLRENLLALLPKSLMGMLAIYHDYRCVLPCCNIVYLSCESN